MSKKYLMLLLILICLTYAFASVYEIPKPLRIDPWLCEHTYVGAELMGRWWKFVRQTPSGLFSFRQNPVKGFVVIHN